MDDIWSAILGRITGEHPVALDDVIQGDAPEAMRGSILAPANGRPPSAGIWKREPIAESCIGIRITERPEDPAKFALRLVAAATERGVVPIILSRTDLSGFEQFGFRIERIPEDEADALAAEEEAARFWDLAIIIDGRDVELLG